MQVTDLSAVHASFFPHPCESSEFPNKRVRFDLPPPPFPDSEMGAIRNPAFREQLGSLCRVLSNMGSPLDSGAGRHLLEFSLALVKQIEGSIALLQSHTNPFAPAETQEAQQRSIAQMEQNGHVILGKLLHLAHIDLVATAQLLTPNDAHGSVDRVHQVFDTHPLTFKRVQDNLDSLAIHVQDTDLQGEARCVETRLPMEISRLLLLRDGSVNFGIIPAIEQWLRDGTGRSAEESRHHNLFYGLQELYTNEELRSIILQAVAPKTDNSEGAMVIRNTLGLSPKAKLHAHHARLVTLSASLSHLRQGRVGSCFATNLGIELMSSKLTSAARDWTQLLYQGYVERSLDDSDYKIPFLPKLPKDNGDQRIRVNKAGERTDGPDTPATLFKAPGIQAAFRELGVTQKKARELFDASVTVLTEKKSIDPYVRIEKLFHVVAEQASKARIVQHKKVEETAEAMLYAFDSMTQHPLLRAWENCLANMAEVELEGHVFTMVSSTVVKVLKNAVQNTLQDEERLDHILSTVTQTLERRIRPLYDPSFSHSAPGTDGRSTKGAYVLYDTQNEEAPRRWKRVDTPKLFQNFLQSVVDETQQQLEAGVLTRSMKAALSTVLTRLQKTIGEDAFIQTILDHYPRGSNDVSAPHDNYHKLEHSPWVDKCGNFSGQVRKTYFELEQKSRLPSFKPYRAVHLLTHLIDMVRQAPEDTQRALASNRFHLIPVGTYGQHAFSLTLGDPSFVRAWFNPHYTRQWIDRELLSVGREVARTPLTTDMYEATLEFCEDEILSGSDKAKFQKAYSEIPEGIWVSDFRDRVLTILTELKYKKKYQRKLDAELLTQLPPAEHQTLINSAVRFADTNWHRDENDVRFAFMHNPFADRLEIWEVEDDGTFSAVDQKGWLLERKWQLSSSILSLFPVEADKAPTTTDLRDWHTLIAAPIVHPEEDRC